MADRWCITSTLESRILPVQSPVGMQLGKTAGYAKGFHLKGIRDGITMGIVGDGTTAEGDMHDAMNAASVWDLPFILLVTDNGVAISTEPDEGRGIKDFAAYAEGFGMRHFSCHGEIFGMYETTCRVAEYVQKQKPVLFHVHTLPRLNAHSSAADYAFDLTSPIRSSHLETSLLELGHLTQEDILTRHDRGTVETSLKTMIWVPSCPRSMKRSKS